MATTPALAAPPGVGGAARRPEEAGLEVGVGLDPLRGASDLRVARVFDVVHRVVAELAPLGEDLPHRVFAPRHHLADLEEGPRHVLLAQHPQEVFGVVAGPVVEGEGDDLAIARAVGDEPGAAAGAADGADGTEADAPGVAVREGVNAAPGDIAAVALQDDPLVVAGVETSLSRLNRDHELVRARPLDRGPGAAFLQWLPVLVEDHEPDPPVGLAAVEAEQAQAPGPVGAEADAEVPGVGPAHIRTRFQLRQCQRLRRPHGEDQVPPRLEEVGVLEPLFVSPRAAGEQQESARDDGGGAQDLAGGGDRQMVGGGLREAC